MSSAAVAVVLGAAELVWLDQQQKHWELGVHLWGRPVRSCISWKRYVDEVVVGSRVFCCSCIFVFLRACCPVPISLVSGADTAVHTWVDVELRVVGQHVAVLIKNPNRSWVHGRGPQQKSTFLPWTGFSKVDWAAFGVWYWVIWQEPRCWSSRNDLGWLVSWKTLWNWCIWGFLCLSFGAWFILCRAAVWPRLVAKLSKHGFFFAKIEWWMISRICGRNLEMGAVVLVGDGLVAVETLGGGIVAESPRGRAVLLHRRPPALLGGNGGGNSRRSRKRRKLLEKHGP